MRSSRSGMWPEREESGLLRDDPRRRPGDLVFNSWPQWGPIAMDFAVPSPVQPGVVAVAAQFQLAAAAAYEDHKRADRNTADRCQEHGFTLVPMVVKSFGGWGFSAQKAFKWLSHAHASRTGQRISQVTVELYSSLSIILMRANARALLARCEAPGGQAADSSQRARRACKHTRCGTHATLHVSLLVCGECRQVVCFRVLP